jgi:hypothetical protein
MLERRFDSNLTERSSPVEADDTAEIFVAVDFRMGVETFLLNRIQVA